MSGVHEDERKMAAESLVEQGFRCPNGVMPPHTRGVRAARETTCRACRQPFLQPEDLAAEGRGWRVVLRCANCGWARRELLDDVTLERLDEELDRGTDQLIEALARLTERNMRDYLDRFATALAYDAILPSDF